MTTKIIRAVALMSGLGCLFGPAPASAGTEPGVTWFLDPEAATGAELHFPCGKYGVFEVRNGRTEGIEPSKCGESKAKICGSEDPPVYPSPEFPKLPKPAEKASPGWIPCREGSCFGATSTLAEAAPWVAVIDWNDLHGWSVGWTIRHLANEAGSPKTAVVLFDLYDQDALEPFSQLGATDVHVLRQLCRIAELADNKGAPRVINMSFGRIRESVDPLSAISCDESRLSCQVAQVLHHLACGGSARCPRNPRTVPVAAAGNEHFDPLFPAVLDEVVAAGALQLERFRSDGTAQPSWETPDYEGKARALVPGYGLCLEDRDADGEWPTPPGTSYAAAIFSGWLGTAWTREREDEPFSPALWFPRMKSSQGTRTYALTHGNREYGGNARAARLFNRTLDPALHACESITAGPGSPRIAHLGASEPVDRLTDSESFMQVLGKLTKKRNSPTPPDRPCVSCVRTESASPPRAAAKIFGGPAIDMAASANGAELYDRFPNFEALPGVERQRVYLRAGGSLYNLDVDGSPVIPANTSSLVFATELPLAEGEQPSLIYFYRWNELEFWTAVPILLRE